MSAGPVVGVVEKGRGRRPFAGLEDDTSAAVWFAGSTRNRICCSRSPPTTRRVNSMSVQVRPSSTTSRRLCATTSMPGTGDLVGPLGSSNCR